MAWLTSSLRQKGASLSPVIGFLHDAAASVILVVLMLGALCSRLFGVSKERGAEAESGGSDAVLSCGTQSTNAGTGSAAYAEDGFHTPVQTRISSPSEDAYETTIRRTPPGQMLFSGMGPTPATPAPAHPVAMTVPARRTSAPPSPTNILPRNLDAVLLAAAATGFADDMPTSAEAQGSEAAPSPANNSDDVDPPTTISALPLSTPPPPPPPSGSIRHCMDERKPVSTVLSTPPDALNTKSGAAYPPDAAPTVPRRIPSATVAVPAARVLTAPFETAAELGDARTPAHAAAAAAAAVALTAAGSSALGVFAAAATPNVADTPTCSWRPTRHPSTGLFRGADDGDDASDSPGSLRLAATGGGAAAACRSDPSHTADVAGAEGLPREDDDNDDSRTLGANRATRAKDQAHLWVEVERIGGAADDEAAAGVAEPASPQEVAETPIAFLNRQQQPLSAASPSGTPGASPALRNRSTAAAGAATALAAVNSTPQTKIRGTPDPKQQQQQSARIAGGAALSKANGSLSTATPRVVASSSKQKRGVVSPTTAAGAAVTPATARRPAGPLVAVVRSPRGTADKNPVARKLNPTSPKPDVASGATAAAAGLDGASASPSLCTSCSETLAAADSGPVPRYAAPTAASIARKTRLLTSQGTPHRSFTRSEFAAGMSVGGVEAGGDGIGVESGGGGDVVGGAPRRSGQEAKLRPTVSGGVFGA
ncbi:hypothetical protein PLESTB_000060100 [Pleodorina starrii]|uniref:Uncharacterized protein n=1 Tax=Pleodorina starrii TaxID=330485 RepID=A0A9W6B9T5_9CHLO|nr:hypothetical protein PLESTM_001612900 [Pleodorina starrii]GLC48109.1 hypothetical protein PLESTB_000060100 [Pleodorina starrii]GLC67358.1 hypothetical protein PLESTF_000547500 [Pleodorina starrii]